MKWLVFTGNLGFEVWVLEVANGITERTIISNWQRFLFLKTKVKIGMKLIKKNWLTLKHVDFVKYAYPSYENPSQFRTYNQFLLESTDGAYLFYDEENETKLKYLYRMMKEKNNIISKN